MDVFDDLADNKKSDDDQINYENEPILISSLSKISKSPKPWSKSPSVASNIGGSVEKSPIKKLVAGNSSKYS